MNLTHRQSLRSVSLSEGWLGLGSAVRTLHAAHHASWANSLPMVKQRHPGVADTIITGLER